MSQSSSDWNQKLTWKRAGESLSQLVDTGNNTAFLSTLCSEMICYPSLLYKTDNIQDKFTHVTIIEGLLEGWD